MIFFNVSKTWLSVHLLMSMVVEVG